MASMLAGLALSASVRLATAGANASIFAIYGGSSTAALAAAGINTRLGGVAGNAKVGYNFSAIEAAHKQDGVTTFLDVDFIWKGRSYLNVGWEASLTDLVSAAVPHLASGAVTGLFLGDVRMCVPPAHANWPAAGSLGTSMEKQVRGSGGSLEPPEHLG